MTSAQKLLAQLTSAGVKLSLTPENKLKIIARKDVLTEAQRASLQLYKAEIVVLLEQTKDKPLSEPIKQSELNPQETPETCSTCTAKLSSDDCAEIIVRFCPMGCNFVFRAFNDYPAAINLGAQLLAETRKTEQKRMTDALEARRAALMKKGFDFYSANMTAENELFPGWIDEYRLKKRIGAPKCSD